MVGCTKLTEQKTSRFITAIIYIVLKWECVVAEAGKVFLIVPDISELRLIRGFTDRQVFRKAAETWRAAGSDSVLYIYISNLLTSSLLILKSVYINSLRVTRVTVRLHFGWQCLQYPFHTGWKPLNTHWHLAFAFNWNGHRQNSLPGIYHCDRNTTPGWTRCFPTLIRRSMLPGCWLVNAFPFISVQVAPEQRSSSGEKKFKLPILIFKILMT